MPDTQQPRLLTPEELAALVKLLREVKKWSQEQLAELSGLSVRTIQRIEGGAPSDLDTRRAIARAFGFEDIDALNKPYTIPNAEEVKAEQEKFEKEHVTLEALPLTSGKQLAILVETTTMDLSSTAFEMRREADEEFAKLEDYFREYRDCADLYSEVQKLEIKEDLQAHIDALKTMGVSLRYATRKFRFKPFGDQASEPRPTTGLYVIAFPLGKEPKEFVTPRSVRMGA